MINESYPFFLQWHLTESCNLRCRYCYQQSPAGEMSYQEIRRAIDEMAGTLQYWGTRYKVRVSPSIHFTGGEPFLRDDLFALLRHARGRGFATSLLTNGTLVTDETAQQLRGSGVQDVQVSLDGQEAVHDRIRGRGTFQKALGGIRNLVSRGIDTNINMTLSSLNYREVDSMVQLAGELGVSAVAFSRLVPCGRGKAMSEHMLTPEQLSGLSRKLAEPGAGDRAALVSRDPVINVVNIPEDAGVPQMDFPAAGCAAGVFGVTIAADGTIMPCRRMDLAVGNIKTDNFRRLWVESPVLSALRDRECYRGNCRTCRYWAVCRGCRAIALAVTQDYLGPDPQCAHYQAIS